MRRLFIIFLIILMTLPIMSLAAPKYLPCSVLKDQIEETIKDNYTFKEYCASVSVAYSEKYRTMLITLECQSTEKTRQLANDIAEWNRDELDANKHENVRIVVRLINGKEPLYVLVNTLYALGPQIYFDKENNIDRQYENKDTDMSVFAFDSYDYLIPVGKKIKLQAKANGIKGKFECVYEISDTSIATYEKGQVFAGEVGETELCAIAKLPDGNEYRAYCTIHTIIPATKIYFEKSEYRGRTYMFKMLTPKVIIEPENATIKRYKLQPPGNTFVQNHISLRPIDAFNNKQLVVKTVDGTNLKGSAKFSCPAIDSDENDTIIINSPSGYDLKFWVNGLENCFNWRGDLIFNDVFSAKEVEDGTRSITEEDNDRFIHITPLKQGEGELSFMHRKKKVLSFHVIVTSEAINNNGDNFFDIGD